MISADLAGRPPATLALALGIGLLLGVERERRKAEGPARAAAGVRTFALVALAGGLCMRLGSEAILAVGAGFVGLSALAGYLRSSQEDPGLTTEVALLVTFLLGALAQRDPPLAAGLGAGVAILLAARGRLHQLVRDTLTEQEVHDGLLFAGAALIVLPLAPDRGLGPYHAFNPFVVWRLVVLVMAISALGYLALRVIGPRFGMPLAGFIGGFVSSTATVGAMGARAAREPALRRGAVAAGVSSTVATVVFLAIVIGAINRDVLREVALSLALAGAAALGYAAIFSLRAARGDDPQGIEHGRAFDLRSAVVVSLAISTLLLVAAALQDALGSAGALLAIAVAGFADSQSAAATAAALVAQGKLDAGQAATAILLAFTTNTASKAVIAVTMGRRAYALEIWPGLALVAGGAWAGLLAGRVL